MFSLTSVAPDVSTDPAGRPREIRADGMRLVVTALESMRDETAAYPVETGPRTVFVVAASGRRFRLVHLLRERSWTVEQLATRRARINHAA